MSGNIWTSNYRNYVYPHLCNSNNKPTGYTSDARIYGWTTEVAITQDVFGITESEITGAISSEYPNSDMSYTDNPYWKARNIHEFIMENYFLKNRYLIKLGCKE